MFFHQYIKRKLTGNRKNVAAALDIHLFRVQQMKLVKCPGCICLLPSGSSHHTGTAVGAEGCRAETGSNKNGDTC